MSDHHRPGGDRPGRLRGTSDRGGLRLGLGLAAVATAAVCLAVGLQPAPVRAASTAIAVDRQDYVSEAGPDAYQAESSTEGTTGPDPIDIHVQAFPQKETYRSFAHLELDGVPRGDAVQSLLATFVPTSDPNRSKIENVNASAVVLDAYPLATELPIAFDPNNPPAADTKGPEVVGKVNADGSWTFELAPMLPYWQQHGNTGFALVADTGATQSPWALGFDRTRSGASATTVPATATTVAPASEAPVATSSAASSSAAAGGGSSYVPPAVSYYSGNGANGALATAAAPASPTAAAPAAAATSTAATGGAPVPRAVLPAATAASGVPLWLVVLAVSTTAAVALLVMPVSAALASAGGALVGLRSQLRLHPRAFAVAGAMLVWSTAFTAYANTGGRNAAPATGAAVADAGPNGGPVGSGGGETSSTSATGSAASAATSGAPGSVPGTVIGPNGVPVPASAATGGRSGGGTRVVGPEPPALDLFPPGEDTIGITPNSVHLCAHAALTFGPAFNIGASDLNVFWQMIDDQGGIWGRKVVDVNGNPGMDYQDDGYQPSRAVTAAQACQDAKAFMLLSGIGFDQIPAVRVWAEQHHMLYLHHIVVQAGSAGLRYSYTMLPSVEQVGTSFGQFSLAHYRGQKIGIIYRNSSNWDPGRFAFKQVLANAGLSNTIVDEEPVNNNQGDYTQQIVKLQGAGAQTVLIWENALAAEQIIQQSSNNGFTPAWMVFPFNLTLQTLEQAKVDTSKMAGVLPWPAYTCNSADKPEFAAYRADIKRFEAAYAKYDRGASLCGGGGDILFGTWLAWEQMADLLQQCGPDCTRNRMAGLMSSGYHSTVGANCAIDFRGGDGHHGGRFEDEYAVRPLGPNNALAWYDTNNCQDPVT